MWYKDLSKSLYYYIISCERKLCFACKMCIYSGSKMSMRSDAWW